MKHENINTIIAVVAVLIALSSLVYTYFQDEKINKINYKVIASENRPQLSIVGEPAILSAKPYIPYTVEDMIEEGKEKKCDLSKELPIRLGDLNLNIKFKNTGKNTAHLIANTQADVYEGNFYLRDLLMGKIDNSHIKGRPSSDFFKSNQIPPQKEKSFDFTSEVANIKDDKFIRHILILYKNDIDMLFDTYCWISVSLDDKNLYKAFEEGNFVITATFNSGDAVNKQHIILEVTETKCDSKLYSEEEAELMLKEVRRICASCNEKKGS
jgi:hypothetical protein